MTDGKHAKIIISPSTVVTFLKLVLNCCVSDPKLPGASVN